jgi:hypothetical protein
LARTQCDLTCTRIEVSRRRCRSRTIATSRCASQCSLFPASSFALVLQPPDNEDGQSRTKEQGDQNREDDHLRLILLNDHIITGLRNSLQ